MVWKQFDNSILSSRIDLGYRSFLKVTVHLNGTYLTLHAILDTGAQDTLINQELLPVFNLPSKKGSADSLITGLGGKGNPGYSYDAVLEIPDYNNVKIKSSVIFTKFDADMLLGQDSFFLNFNVLFKGREGKFEINQVKNLKYIVENN